MTEHKNYCLTEILTTSPLLHTIVNKVEQLSKLNRIVQQKLDPELAKYCRVANLRDGILILTAFSPATGHLLRFAQGDLLSALRAEPEWLHLKSIKILIRPPATFHTTVALTPANPPLALSETACTAIRSLAEAIPFKPLQQALLQLTQQKP